MVLMTNRNTLEVGSCAQRTENSMQVMSELLREAWLTVAGAVHPGISNITPVALSRSGRGALTTPFSRW